MIRRISLWRGSGISLISSSSGGTITPGSRKLAWNDSMCLMVPRPTRAPSGFAVCPHHAVAHDAAPLGMLSVNSANAAQARGPYTEAVPPSIKSATPSASATSAAVAPRAAAALAW